MDPSVQDKQYIKMTETPVWSLVLKLAIPTTISMLITNIYNTADTYFVSSISVSASAATGIVFALMALFQAFGFMFGHGAGSNASRLLGAKEIDGASTFTSTSFLMSAATGVLLGIIGLIFIDPLMYLLGSTDTILPEARAYAFYILLAGPAMTCSCVLNNILRYEGRASFAMIGLVSGGLLNMALDPLFIFVFKMGTGGAGLSTMISQYVGLTILLIPFLRKQTATRISPKYIARDITIAWNIIATGLPNLIRQGLTSLSTTILNNQAAAYGDAAIAAFSIVTRCVNLIFSFAIGIAQGFQPVAAFNYGAKKYDRVRISFLFTVITSVVLVGCLALGCVLNASDVICIFRDDPEVVEIGTDYLRYMCAGVLALPFSAIGSMLFQSTNQKSKAAFLATLQSGGILIPLLLILPSFLGLTGIEISMPLSYIIAAIIAIPMSYKFISSLKSYEICYNGESF